MDEINEFICELVENYEIVEGAEVLMHPAYEPIGRCPCCESDVTEKSKGFFCSNKDCKFALWKDNRFFDSLSKKITKQIAEQLLSKGNVKLKKCRSIKTGKTYDAIDFYCNTCKCSLHMSMEETGNPYRIVMDALGITANTVSKLEPGMRMPSLDLVADIAAYFKVNLNWLMMGIGEPYLND